MQELIWYQSLWRDEDQSLKNKIFWQISPWNVSNSSIRPYGAFCFDLQVLSGTTSNGLINPSSHPIHKLFGMEVEDDCISQETRSLWGFYWNWKRDLWEWEWLAKSGIILGANFSPVGYFSMFFSQKTFAILYFLKLHPILMG